MIDSERTMVEGLLILTPKISRDDRGYFFEAYNKTDFISAGVDVNFVQDNESCSSKNVLRGLHYQAPPFEQGKLVRVVRGAALDVAVDIRKNSPTYGKHLMVRLDQENKRMFWIPPGFAHGFLSLEEDTVLMYKCTNFYNRASEGSLLWNDSRLAIGWGVSNPIVSQKDREAPGFNIFQSPF